MYITEVFKGQLIMQLQSLMDHKISSKQNKVIKWNEWPTLWNYAVKDKKQR